MTWLYVAMAGAVVVRWGLWHLRGVIERIETPRRDGVSSAMCARLRRRGSHGVYPVDSAPVLHLPGETASGPRGA